MCSKVRSTKEFYTLVAERDRLRKRFYEDVGIFSIIILFVLFHFFFASTFSFQLLLYIMLFTILIILPMSRYGINTILMG